MFRNGPAYFEHALTMVYIHLAGKLSRVNSTDHANTNNINISISEDDIEQAVPR